MTNRSDEYDVIVLGVGTAGSKAARVAGEAGARVLAVESGERLGGLCILRGCMPTKTMLESAHRLHDARSSQDFGLVGGEGVSLDFAKHMERTQSLVERFRRAKVSGIESGPYEVRRATPRFVGPNEIELDGKERLKAKAFVVATGSKVSPFPFELPDGARILDSDDLFKLDEPPERTLVVGAGAVGLEFAQWLARVGSEVTLMNRSKLLRRWDVEMGEDLEAALSREMRVLVPSSVRLIEKLESGIRLHVTRPDQEEVTVEVDAILNATGRMPNFDGLNLEATGLDMESLPAANDSMQSSVEHVFLAGDCSGHHQILHTANVEGAIAGRNAARVAQKLDGGPEGWPENYPDVEAVFTDPPFASVGHSIEPLRQAGVKFLHAEKHFSGQGRGIVMGAQHGFIRLLAEESGTLLGAQILGPRADDLIHVFSTAIGLGASAQDMERLPWYHPTLCEAILDVVRDVASQANSDR